MQEKSSPTCRVSGFPLSKKLHQSSETGMIGFPIFLA
jgi:hypothetical protein